MNAISTLLLFTTALATAPPPETVVVKDIEFTLRGEKRKGTLHVLVNKDEDPVRFIKENRCVAGFWYFIKDRGKESTTHWTGVLSYETFNTDPRPTYEIITIRKQGHLKNLPAATRARVEEVLFKGKRTYNVLLRETGQPNEYELIGYSSDNVRDFFKLNQHLEYNARAIPAGPGKTPHDPPDGAASEFDAVGKMVFVNTFAEPAEERFAYVKPGEFKMGSPQAEKERKKDEPEHVVHITRPFLIARHEVTQNEYHAIVGKRPSWFFRDEVRSGNFPVDSVTWFDALWYCNLLSQRRGLAPYYEITEITRKGTAIIAAKVKVPGGPGYRLPTEAEWEYACRAGTITTHHFGTLARDSRVNKRGNFRYSLTVPTYGLAFHSPGMTREVGKFIRNPWGLYDMHGNVAEWCWDWYDKSYYSRSPKADPTGPASGIHRVLRGGSYLVSQHNCRSASRFWSHPAETKFYIGFRVARDAPLDKDQEPPGEKEGDEKSPQP